MPEQLWFTAILNHLFAGPVTSLLLALGIKPKSLTAPIPNSLAMEILVFAFLLVLFVMVRSRLSVDRPGALQHTFEGVEGFIQGQSDEIIGHHSEGYTAFLTALTLFILFCNLIGVIPGFESPTAVAVVPLGCALCAFVYYNTQGFKHAGLGYLKHFAGP
ncbi:MAG: F0F1 ATP synthase subunit A, partial [Candidatus Sulfotelmatobacter sp.]